MKKFLLLLSLIPAGLLAACGSDEGAASDVEKKDLVLGGTIPYSDMLEGGVKPYLEELGYTVEVREFNDYVQPNTALGSGSLDANLFQHEVYMTAFAEEHDMDLSGVIRVPTAPMAIYSEKFDSLDEIEPGSTVAIPNDPTNTARGLTVLRDSGLLEFDEDVNPLRVTENDVTSNPLDLKIETLEAAQLPRSLSSVDLAAINGNFAISAGLDLTTSLAKDNIPENIINQVVVLTENLDDQYVQDIKEAIESDEFKQFIEEEFQGFHQPDWMRE
ncbi:MetQ/NlpA family ABC transporter substrate-binding protein [Evansella clarkii]|uniref:MetQ/NlpA family ABC transporter substrate-binding protein n=1 Tax=Evansella clarkii TaxID=79879 RepID=UPI000B44DB38|nr:MetQ/NlpA family ABC transporter substrate-binding protein [Evansella clarkii]